MPEAEAALTALLVAWLRRAADAVHDERARLTELDAAIGDGDHGINLDRGLEAVRRDLDVPEALESAPDALLTATGRRILGVVGGASGALYGRGFMRAGAALGTRLADGTPRPDAMAEAILAGLIDGIVSLGHAQAGDKTMLDALMPAVDRLRAARAAAEEPAVALAAAAMAGEQGAAATIPLVARKGRASYLGERSAGHLDPGAASAALLVRCLAEVVERSSRPSLD